MSHCAQTLLKWRDALRSDLAVQRCHSAEDTDDSEESMTCDVSAATSQRLKLIIIERGMYSSALFSLSVGFNGARYCGAKFIDCCDHLIESWLLDRIVSGLLQHDGLDRHSLDASQK